MHASTTVLYVWAGGSEPEARPDWPETRHNHDTLGRPDHRYRGPLWSAATAQEIVELISDETTRGSLMPVEGLDLIERVRARATSEYDPELPMLPGQIPLG